MTGRVTRRGLPGAPRLDPPLPGAGEESPFLRPRRARPRRLRRGGASSLIFWLQAGGALLIGLVGLWLGYSRVMASDELKVKRVVVRGNHFLSEGEIRELLGPADGENILDLDIGDLGRRLRASPWLQDATVRRSLPDTLEVDVRERQPLALAEVDRLYLMDAGGDLIDLYGSRTAAYDLPIVRGLGGLADEARRDRAQRAGALLADLGELSAEVSEIEVEPGGDLRVVLRGGVEVVKLGAPPCRKAFAAFLSMRRELGERCPRAEYFDLRFRDRIYVKEPPAPRAVAAAREK